MVDEKGTVRLVDNLLFPKIFQTFRMAIHPTKLIIAFLAVVVMFVAGWAMDFSKTVVSTPDIEGKETELQVYIAEPEQTQAYIAEYAEKGQRSGVFATLLRFASGTFHGDIRCLFALDLQGVFANVIEYLQAMKWAVKYHLLYVIIFSVIELIVMAIAGGAICRIAALQFAREEKPGLTEALRFSIRKFTSLVTAPLAPFGIIIFIGLFIFLLGLVGNIPRAGELIMGIFMFLALMAGALITVLLIGTFAGFNLMFPAIAYDNSDCFDAISRAFSYIYSRPWRMGFYTVLAGIYGVICYSFVRFFTFLLLWSTRRSLQLGILGDNSKLTAIWPHKPAFGNLLGPSGLSAAANWAQWLGAALVYLCLLVVIGFVIAFIISFYFSANTIIYALMRKKVDNTALDDVYTFSEEAEPATTESNSQQPTDSESKEESPSES